MKYNDGLGRALLSMAGSRATSRADPQVILEHWDWRAPAQGWFQVYAALVPAPCLLRCVRVRCTSTIRGVETPMLNVDELWWFAVEYEEGGQRGYMVVRAWGDEPCLELVAQPGHTTREAITEMMTRRAAMDAQALAEGACPCGGPCEQHQRPSVLEGGFH